MEAIRHPGRVIDNVLRAAEELGRTMYDAFAGHVERGEAVALAGLRLGRAMRSILEGAWEVGGGLLGLVVGVLVNALGTFRPLAASERGELQLVFGGSRDPDRVFVSTEDPLSTVPFGIQDFFFRQSRLPGVGDDEPDRRRGRRARDRRRRHDEPAARDLRARAHPRFGRPITSARST